MAKCVRKWHRGVFGSDSVCVCVRVCGQEGGGQKDGWWDRIRVGSLVTKNPIQTQRLRPLSLSWFRGFLFRPLPFESSQSCSFQLHISLRWKLFLPHQPKNAHTTRLSHLLFHQRLTGCFRRASMCVRIPMSVCWWGGGGVSDLLPTFSSSTEFLWNDTWTETSVHLWPATYYNCLNNAPWPFSTRTIPPKTHTHAYTHLPQLDTKVKEATTAWSTPSIPCH